MDKDDVYLKVSTTFSHPGKTLSDSSPSEIIHLLYLPHLVHWLLDHKQFDLHRNNWKETVRTIKERGINSTKTLSIINIQKIWHEKEQEH